ncbi:hypothetical protein K466DRAFT_598503 [Polyporus arcularius HHB13444]|uniref:Uncharacterized protein n=1 Tax=Polyporus arcularius HHB13444 TaxID=1314778 RepID=A0A5C3PJU7_9APHY|nr:hypothetical protein K466DRAFT_598503 [Polyporus arcularius HHB13444]
MPRWSPQDPLLFVVMRENVDGYRLYCLHGARSEPAIPHEVEGGSARDAPSNRASEFPATGAERKREPSTTPTRDTYQFSPLKDGGYRYDPPHADDSVAIQHPVKQYLRCLKWSLKVSANPGTGGGQRAFSEAWDSDTFIPTRRVRSLIRTRPGSMDEQRSDHPACGLERGSHGRSTLRHQDRRSSLNVD